jgi:serine/threonine protein kinase
LHSNGFIHRDIKPDNIIISHNHITEEFENAKIIDFGLSAYENVSSLQLCGTPGFIAPEVFYADGVNNKYRYDGRADVFSLGAILYKL